jgi:hypothetical protein
LAFSAFPSEVKAVGKALQRSTGREDALSCFDTSDSQHQEPGIIDGFVPEFARLPIVTLMLPWGD